MVIFLLLFYDMLFGPLTITKYWEKFNLTSYVREALGYLLDVAA